MAQKVENLSFRKSIPALDSSYVEKEVKDYGTAEKLCVYFAQGQNFDLKVNPVIIQSGSEVPTPLIDYAPETDNFISGDDIYFERKITRPVTPGDKIRIYYESLDDTNAMNLSVDVEVDYYGGNVRVL